MSYVEDLGTTDPFLTIGQNGSEKWADMNKGVTPVFYIEAVENPTKSEEAGRPIFDEVESVRIFIAGDAGTQINSPVTAEYRERFADAYAAWKANRREAEFVSGTPLRQWHALTPARVKEFEALKIFNVEGLANLGETALQKHFGLREWAEKAKAWLENAKDGSFATHLAAENLRLKDEMAELRKQVAELAAQVGEERRGPGRPRKEAA